MTRLFLMAVLVLAPVSLTAAALGVTELPPPPNEVTKVPEELREAFRREVVDTTRLPEARLEKLVKFVFGREGLGISYKSDATHTVAESFQTGTVNCLSSTLLIVALAREAGLKAKGQRVDSILVWGAKGEVAIQSQHANAIIDVGNERRFVVDVDSSDVPATDALHPISDEQLLAYFYGNRAMELMLDGRLPEASAWMMEALRHGPNDASLWNNAGVLSLRMGELAIAETRFLKAVNADSKQVSALSNLISFYQRKGDVARATQWQARSESVLRKAPYYQFQLGRQFERNGDMRSAIRYYRRAISLNKVEHRFHFALAQVYFGVGQWRKAERELSIAHDLSEGAVRDRYQGKLAALRRMQH